MGYVKLDRAVDALEFAVPSNQHSFRHPDESRDLDFLQLVVPNA